MSTLLLRNADIVATMNDESEEIHRGGVFCRDGVIEIVGSNDVLPSTADAVFDLSGHVVIPGMVNTHHHLFQNMTRVTAQNGTLFNWLQALYPVWRKMGPEHVHAAVALGLAELALSGCSTSSDHQYLFPNGARLDDSIAAAGEVGVRFHATRGSMSIGESKGGLPPDDMTENEDAVLADCERVIASWHNPDRYAMLRVAVAPCSPFSVSRELMRDSATLARRHKVGLHTHLAENDEDVKYSVAHFGMLPGEYAESLGWTGKDVWHAHCVMLNEKEINMFARTHTSIAHCPCSNMRLGSGIAPIRAMLDADVGVGLGVDGSASNDSGNLLNEARQAMLLQRVRGGPSALTAREALHIATRGGARALNRDDIGALIPGYAADIACFDVRGIDFAGAQADLLAALVFCGPVKAAHTIINGRVVVENGELKTIDLPRLLDRHKTLATQLTA